MLQNLLLHGVLLIKPKEKKEYVYIILLLHTKINTYYIHTVIDWLIAAATITLRRKTMWLLCEGGYYPRVGTICIRETRIRHLCGPASQVLRNAKRQHNKELMLTGKKVSSFTKITKLKVKVVVLATLAELAGALIS